MKPNIKRNLAIVGIVLALLLVGAIAGSPVIALAQTGFWSGSIPTTTTESLVVKVGSTILDNGYVFNPVELKTGDSKVYTLTVENTGATTTWTVKHTVASSNPSYLTATIVPDQRVIPPGESRDFTLTLTAILAKPDMSITMSFTRE